jgi:RNA polymerase sigma factor (sigma-70 family)
MATRSEPGLGAIMRERGQLINLGYRLLGSLAEAEDVVQETYARWYALPAGDREAIESPGGWLTTVASRICLDVLRSARVRRERYVGEWIPEPLPEPTEWVTADPADRVTLDESVTMAFLVVLESMPPAERVALILHDVFGYPFAEVAGIVGRTPAACRQLAYSARRRVRGRRAPATPAAEPAGIALRPIGGGEQVARFAVALADRTAGLTILERTVNGQPGLVTQQHGRTVAVVAFAVAADRITHIWAVRNPDKLRPWTPGPGAGPAR